MDGQFGDWLYASKTRMTKKIMEDAGVQSTRDLPPRVCEHLSGCCGHLRKDQENPLRGNGRDVIFQRDVVFYEEKCSGGSAVLPSKTGDDPP